MCSCVGVPNLKKNFKVTTHTHGHEHMSCDELSRFQLHLHLRNTSTITNPGPRAPVATFDVVLEELSRQEERKK